MRHHGWFWEVLGLAAALSFGRSGKLCILRYVVFLAFSFCFVFFSACWFQTWNIVLLCQVDRSRGFPILKFKDRESYASNKTKEYDDLAMKYLSLYIHWSTNATRVGIHGYCHHAPVVYILLVCYWQWVIKFQIVGKLWIWCMIYLFQVSLWCVHSCSLIISWNQLLIYHGDRWLTNF